jgi:hypothetical protein
VRSTFPFSKIEYPRIYLYVLKNLSGFSSPSVVVKPNNTAEERIGFTWSVKYVVNTNAIENQKNEPMREWI